MDAITCLLQNSNDFAGHLRVYRCGIGGRRRIPRRLGVLHLDGVRLAIDGCELAIDLHAHGFAIDLQGVFCGAICRGRRCSILLFDLPHADLALALQKIHPLIAARRHDKNVLVRRLNPLGVQQVLRGSSALLRVRIIAFERRLIRGFKPQLLGRDFYDLGIGRHRGLAKITEHHLPVGFGDSFPRAKHHVVEGLLKIELRHGRDRRAKPPARHHVAHGFDHIGIFVHNAIVAQHLRVGGQRAARHGAPRNQGFDRRGFWRQKIIRHALLKHLFGIADFLNVDVQIVIRAAQGVPHHQNIGLACASGTRRQRQIDGIGARIQRGEIGLHADPGGFMGVKVNPCIGRQEVARPLDSLIHLRRHSRTGRILKTHGVVGNVGVQNPAQGLLVKIRVVRAFATRGQFHQGDAHLVVQPGIYDALPAVDQVIHVVERVKIANGRNAVLFEQLGVQFDDVTRLGFQPDHVHAARQRLQIGIRACGFAERIGHGKRIFVAIKVQGLKPRPAAGFVIIDAGFACGLHCGQKIGCEHARAVHGLKTISKRRTHKCHFFLFHSSKSLDEYRAY